MGEARGEVVAVFGGRRGEERKRGRDSLGALGITIG
jgi:hypothetical protein